MPVQREHSRDVFRERYPPLLVFKWHDAGTGGALIKFAVCRGITAQLCIVCTPAELQPCLRSDVTSSCGWWSINSS